MSAGMAGVIETHKEIENLDGYTWGCSCEWRAGLNDDHPAHVAEELAKAGYGLLDPLAAALADPEGHALVKAIRDRKAEA